MASATDLVGVILAGGRSSRMGGGDKGLRLLAGQPIVLHVVERLRPQVRILALNANENPARFDRLGLPVIADSVPGFPGPLAGILAGFRFAASAGAAAVVTVPCDTPFVPSDLAMRLAAAADAGVAVAWSQGRDHPTVGLFPVDLIDDLETFLAAGDSHRVRDWVNRHHPRRADFSSEPSLGLDPFFNINTPADLATAEAAVRPHPA